MESGGTQHIELISADRVAHIVFLRRSTTEVRKKIRNYLFSYLMSEKEILFTRFQQ
ncbi:hypothetical protein N037_20030 [Enterobacter sp. EGD-HP1]|nr:hypothetical protein N037_20030 [Enterobacter sp. EGD-HP1]